MLIRIENKFINPAFISDMTLTRMAISISHSNGKTSNFKFSEPEEVLDALEKIGCEISEHEDQFSQTELDLIDMVAADIYREWNDQNGYVLFIQKNSDFTPFSQIKKEGGNFCVKTHGENDYEPCDNFKAFLKRLDGDFCKVRDKARKK